MNPSPSPPGRRSFPLSVLLWGVAALLLAGGSWARAAPGDPVPVRSGQDTVATSGVGAGDTAAAIVAPEESGPQVRTQAAGEAAAQARADLDTPFHERIVSILGLLVMIGIAWAISVDRRRFPVRIVVWGVTLQLVFALLILRTAPGEQFFALINDVFIQLLAYTQDGSRFIFGNLVDNNIPVGMPVGEPAHMAPVESSGQWANAGAYFAFTVLPTIIFFSSFMTILYFLGIMQGFVKGVAWIMQRTMGTSGAETLSASGNIFVGQTEAPLMIKPFVEEMTMSELHCVMTGGFATVAGGVMAAYVGMLQPFFRDIAGHLMAASVMSAPAALVVAKLMYPEEGEPETATTLDLALEKPDVNVIDAAARGAGEGLHLALNVGAMLLAFVALVALLDGILGLAGGWVGFEGLSLQLILGWLLAPVASIMGVPWADAAVVGSLMGLKTALNEFFAYLQLADILSGGGPGLQPRSIIISAYALSGFANFSSIAIQIGGIGGIAPSRRHDLSALGLRAMIGGTIAAFMTATVAGMLL